MHCQNHHHIHDSFSSTSDNMPQSKRSKVVHLTRVAKKTREHKDKLFGRIRTAVGQYKYIFVVGLENLRNTHLRELRQQFADSQCALPFPPCDP